MRSCGVKPLEMRTGPGAGVAGLPAPHRGLAAKPPGPMDAGANRPLKARYRVDLQTRLMLAGRAQATRLRNPGLSATRLMQATHPRALPPSAPPVAGMHPIPPDANARIGNTPFNALAPDEGETRIDPLFQWLGTKGADMANEAIAAKASALPQHDGLAYLCDIPYGGPNGASLAADVYRPKDTSADPLPIVVFVHGGGLFMGSRKINREFAELVAERGYVVFAPEYRLLEETDCIGEIADVCAGLAYLENHASELGGDLSRVLVIGESAGALATLYATALLGSPPLQDALGIGAPELSVRGLVCIGGMLYTTGNDPVGLAYRRPLYGSLLRDGDFMELMNPENPMVESGLPPVLQVTSGADFLKSHTLRYDEALEAAGHAHRLIYYEEGKELTHAFPSLRPELPQSREVLDEIGTWFKELCA